MNPAELDRMEKGLVCLVPKESAVNESSMLLTCHEYSVCDCTVLRLIADLRKCVEALEEIQTAHARTPAESEDGTAYYSNYHRLKASQRRAETCLSSLSTKFGGGE